MGSGNMACRQLYTVPFTTSHFVLIHILSTGPIVTRKLQLTPTKTDRPCIIQENVYENAVIRLCICVLKVIQRKSNCDLTIYTHHNDAWLVAVRDSCHPNQSGCQEP